MLALEPIDPTPRLRSVGLFVVVAFASLALTRAGHVRASAIALVGAITGLLREWQAHQPPLAVDEIAAEIRDLMLAAITRP